ncbi:MAG: 4Fe-4S ferredoxin [Deltaproteobacteria bacterium HGW-Deltaproteobacteria-8]|jgi:tetrathionate reductase subunit B|nr:MAG: 4Fe-4S ferredoxin [Deltaproteobacteria bacterium HGW-Deltaproteobacteria-8]
MSTQKLAMVIDSAKCIDCKGCVAACKQANGVSRGVWRNWIKEAVPPLVNASDGSKKLGHGHFQPGACMHCDEPTCIQACPTGATYKSASDGTVVIDPRLCIGCGNCIKACPYGARFRDPVKRIADKCNYCPERRAAGLAPACVDTCPTKARVFGDINDPNSDAAKLLAANQGKVVRVIAKGKDTKPNMYYIASTAPDGWAVQPVDPLSFDFLAGVVAPAVKWAVGLSGLGVLAMLGRQLFVGAGTHGSGGAHGTDDKPNGGKPSDDKPNTEKKEEGGHA